MNCSLQKHRFNAVLNYWTQTPRSTKKRSGWKKTLSGSPAHKRENAYYRNLKWTIGGLSPCYCYAIKTKTTTIRLQVSQSHLQAKNRTRANCAVALSVTGDLRLRLCPDEPSVHLFGPAYMPSCIVLEVRLSLYQRVLSGDCCKKCTMSSPGRLLFCDIFGAYDQICTLAQPAG